MDTNIAEQYNSIVCKFVDEKRINFSGKRSYLTRCEAAAVYFNTQGHYLVSYYDELFGHGELPSLLKRVTNRTKRKRLLRLNKPIIRKKKIVAAAEKYHVPDAQGDSDLPEEQYLLKEAEFVKHLELTQKEIQESEIKTR
ncbi:unnamed protein product [Psylliodes chrysocephalus]|uniref:Uncharacterized protein n=1 Tax=Psylliodes chrysocephalus TaxID=3402493 RepID=A0A9P0CYJ2_9CUCU|nr:unnamed protein product [Psylliodes chrysocephala]